MLSADVATQGLSTLEDFIALVAYELESFAVFRNSHCWRILVYWLFLNWLFNNEVFVSTRTLLALRLLLVQSLAALRDGVVRNHLLGLFLGYDLFVETFQFPFFKDCWRRKMFKFAIIIRFDLFILRTFLSSLDFINLIIYLLCLNFVKHIVIAMISFTWPIFFRKFSTGLSWLTWALIFWFTGLF